MSKRLVIALGGNALGKTPQEQLDLVKGTASTIVDLVEEGYDVVIGHGNGPKWVWSTWPLSTRPTTVAALPPCLSPSVAP